MASSLYPHGPSRPSGLQRQSPSRAPKEKGSHPLQASHACPDLQEALRSGVQLHWAGPPPSMTHLFKTPPEPCLTMV